MIVTDQPVQKYPVSHSKRKATLVIHGGAGGTIPPHLPPDLDRAYRDALRRALVRGYEVLSKGGSALDAVCRSVQEMEDDPLFNAAKGAVFNKEGGIECEASVMNAKAPCTVGGQMQTQHDRRCASAILVRNTRNPILLAKVLYENERDNPHVILSGLTAEEIGWKHNTVKVDSTYYYTRKRWLEHRRALGLPDDDDDENPGGCVRSERLFPADIEPPPSYYANSVQSDGTPSFDEESIEDGKDTERDTTTEAVTPSNQSADYDMGLQSFIHWDVNFDRRSSTGHDDLYASRSSSFEELNLPANSSSTSLHRRQLMASTESLPAGTVGAVAVDEDGNLAVATSTGGITNKLPGRIGDTPTPSAGFWAEYWKPEKGFMPRTFKQDQQQCATEKEESRPEEREPRRRRWTACDWVRWIFCAGIDAKENQDEEDAIAQGSNPPKLARESSKAMNATSQPYRGVAISGTGTGDYFLRSSFASLLAHRMRFLGESVDVAGRKAVAEMADLGGVGGAICIDDAGRVAFPMKTAVMNRGYITHDSGPRVAIFANEECR